MNTLLKALIMGTSQPCRRFLAELLFWLLVASGTDGFHQMTSAGIISMRPAPTGLHKQMEMSLQISWNFCSDSLIQYAQEVNRFFRTTASPLGATTCDVGCQNDYDMPVNYSCANASNGEVWSVAQQTTLLNFSDANEYVNIQYIPNWMWFIDVPWYIAIAMNLTTRNDIGVINSSPTITVFPVVQFQEGCKHTLQLPVNDSDGDQIKCYLADNHDCDGMCNDHAGVTLNSDSCILHYDANYGIGHKLFVIKIEDFIPSLDTPLSTVKLQYVVDVYASNNSCPSPPEIIPPTPRSGSCVAIPLGESYKDEIVIYSTNVGQTITLNLTESPDGLVISPVYQNLEPTIFVANITWFPKEYQVNKTHDLCFYARDTLGFTSNESCIQYMVGSSPSIRFSDISLDRAGRIHPRRVLFTITYDQLIHRPEVEANILFQDYENDVLIYKINSALSNEVQFDQTNITVSPNFTFPEKRKIYVTTERGIVVGFSGCEPGSEAVIRKDFLMFKTQDVTPPVIKSIKTPLKTRENVSFEWTANEPVSSICILDAGPEQNCSDGQFYAFGLQEGIHKLAIELTDRENNTANVTYTFVVDLTAPNTSFEQVPGTISNSNPFVFRFSCNEPDEDCVFYCQFYKASLNSTTYSLCDGASFLTPPLENEQAYMLSVYAVDSVNNTGAPVEYRWTVDLTPPYIEANNTNIECIEGIPSNLAYVYDNIDSEIELTFTDIQSMCYVTRTWTARDDAGNIVHKDQIITKTFNPTIFYLPQLLAPCSNESGTITVTTDTAKIYNPCGRPLTVTHTDQPQIPSCPGEVNRTWSVTDTCSGKEISEQQTIKLYNVCPVVACGRNYSPPHGICSEGDCQCNRPWYGNNCESAYYEPIIQENGPIILQESQNIVIQPLLIQGTSPILWSLISAPDGTSIHYSTGKVILERAPAGNLTFHVKAANQVGHDDVLYTVNVLKTYSAHLDPLSNSTFVQSQRILLTGFVQHHNVSSIHSLINESVPVLIEIYSPSNGIMRTFNVQSNQESKFFMIFRPSSSEYGIYKALARHPSDLQKQQEIEWKILGMRFFHRSVLLDGITSGSYHKVYSNITLLINDGPEDLHNIQALPFSDALLHQGINLTITFHGKSLVKSLASGEQIEVNAEISTLSAVSGAFYVVITSSEGTTAYVTINLKIQDNFPKLLLSPNSLNAVIKRGDVRSFGFSVTNTGEIRASNVSIDIPNSPFFTLASFGVRDSFGNSFTLNNQDKASGTLLVHIPFNQTLGSLYGAFAIKSEEVSTTLPYHIVVASDNKVNLTLTVENEYTYFVQGSPLVSNAIIKLKNIKHGIDLIQSTSEHNGSVTFTNIPKDRYEISIEAPGHISKQDVIFASADTSSNKIFLQHKGVTYKFVVKPALFEDKYIFTLEADFEVNVPVPVVTVNPNSFDLEYFELGLTTQLEFNITNQGLIRVNDVHLELPTEHPSLKFSALVEVPSFLDGKQIVLVPLKITQTGMQSCSPGSVRITRLYIGYVHYSYLAHEKIYKKTPILFAGSICRSTHLSHSITYTEGGAEGGWIWNGTGTPSTTFVRESNIFCNPCAGVVFKCVPKLKFTDISLLPLIQKEKVQQDFAEALTWLSAIGDLGRLLISVFINPPSSLEPFCLREIYQSCLSVSYEQSAPTRQKRSSRDIALIFAEGLYPIHLSLLYATHIFGNETWLLLNDTEWVTETFKPIFDDNSDQGQLVSTAELDIVLSKPPPQYITYEDIHRIIMRLNTTRSKWNSGELELLDADDNMISYSFLEDVLHNISIYSEKTVNQGFTSYIDAFSFAANAFENMKDWPEEAGVCAVVRIQIQQEVTLTRVGFAATLTIENSEIQNLENITVTLNIYNSITREFSNLKFSTGTIKLHDSLTGVNGNGTLSAGSSGTAEWFIIPYSEAALNASTLYDIGGQLSYNVGSKYVDVTLEPARITVLPDPSLVVHYFWEKNVYSDDPFTAEIEPAVPFSLGVMIKNEGFGTARNMEINSAQPEIIENEKGLVISFQIIGAFIDDKPMNPSLEVDFGDILPNTTKTARWWMTSSLIGEFKRYSATFENINPLGDKKLSVIDDLKIHELIRNVRIPGDSDDEVLDFLVNDVYDLHASPDTIYDSRDMSYYPVNQGNITSFRKYYSSDSVIVEVWVRPVGIGWTYFTFQDETLLEIPLGETVKLMRQRGNGTNPADLQELPNENAWVSINVLGKTRRKSLSILDNLSDPLNDTYYSMEFRKQQIKDFTLSPEFTSEGTLSTSPSPGMCSVNSCGFNQSPPHGICSDGSCYCNKPWYGDTCEARLYQPKINQTKPILLLESQDVDIQPILLQGTEPVIWGIVSAPENTTIHYSSGRIYLREVPAGEYTFTIKAENEIGEDEATYQVFVKLTYSAHLNPLPVGTFAKAQPVLLTGFIVHETNSPIREFHNGSVLVTVRIYNSFSGIVRTLTGQSGKGSNFSVTFHPLPSEYGIYNASASHPSETPGEPQVTWKILGMQTSHGSLSLKGRTNGPYTHNYSNITTLINDGPGDLTFIEATYIPDGDSSGNANLNVTFGEHQKLYTLASGARAMVNVKLSVPGVLQESFLVVLQASEGTKTIIKVDIDIKESRSKLEVVPNRLDTIVEQGKQKFFRFLVTNVGQESAYDVHFRIPDSPFFTLASFGLDGVYGNGIDINNNKSASGTLLVQIPVDEPLGSLSGSLFVTSNSTYTKIPYNIIIASNNRINLSIIVEDEYTYFADGNPLVADAIIMVKNHELGIERTQSTSDYNGKTVFLNVPESMYEITIEAPGHASMNDVIFVSLATSINTIFLERRAVKFELIVTPILFTDRYLITLEADYEVNVPMPVVTVSPRSVTYTSWLSGTNYFVDLNVTNHGLIRVDYVSLELPVISEIGFIRYPMTIPVSLEPKSSVIIPLGMERFRKKRTPALGTWVLRTAVYAGKLMYSFLCKGRQWRSVPIPFIGQEKSQITEYQDFADFWDVNWFSGTSHSGSPMSLNMLKRVLCDPCTNAVLGILSKFTGGPEVAGTASLPNIASQKEPQNIKEALGVGIGVAKDVSRFGSTKLGRYADLASWGNDIDSLYKECISRVIRRHKRSTRDVAIIFVEGYIPIKLSIIYLAHIFGDEKWITLNDTSWVSETLRPIFDDNSELGKFVSQDEFISVLNGTKPQNITDEEIEKLIYRFNTTEARWDAGELEPMNEDENMMSFSFLETLQYNISVFNNIAKDKGFESYKDAFNFAINAFRDIDDWYEEAGVCAIVRIQINQNATLTRTGFSAKLEIENNEEENLENLRVAILLYDARTDKEASLKFSVGSAKISGDLTEVNGNGTLLAGSSGTAEWFIIPYSEAAPFTATQYKVGGQFSYTVGSKTVDIPLEPARITVLPDPSLIVHYFWEKNVYSDDPFTDEIEPAVPFSLGVMIKNEGFGTARNMKINSAQPEIIENEKGLLISFQIIGAFIDNEPMNPSLDVDFGDILPNTTKTARWWMTTTLIGEFKQYSAKFQNINPLGDPKLSVIDELKIHDLIRNVRIPGEHDDGLLDFLVNDIFDLYAIPDRIYDSRDMSNYSVSQGNIYSLQKETRGNATTLTARVTASTDGFCFFTLRHSTTDQLPLWKVSRLTRYENLLTRSTNMQVLPNDNAWISVNVLGKVRKQSLNILDYISHANRSIYYSIEILENDTMSSVTLEGNATENGNPGTTTESATYETVSPNTGTLENWSTATMSPETATPKANTLSTLTPKMGQPETSTNPITKPPVVKQDSDKHSERKNIKDILIKIIHGVKICG